MLSRQAIHCVLQERPDLIFVDGYFFLTPFDQIMIGISCEVRPQGATITKFYYPLFDWSDFIHIGFSEHLQEGLGFIDFQKVPKRRVVEEVLERIQEIRAEKGPSVLEFVALAKTIPGVIDNPRLKLTYATALILLDDVLDANRHIRDALKSRTASSDKVFFEHCSTLLSLLDQGRNQAQEYIDHRVETVRSRILGE